MNPIKISTFLLLISTLLISSFSFADGGLIVNPVYLKASPQQPITNLTLTNNSDQTVSYQLDAKHWSQTNNQDTLTPANNIIISPPLVTLASKQKQVVRIVPEELLAEANNPRKLNTEESYRIFVKQLPTNTLKKVTGVNILMDFSLPFFITPTIPVNALAWHLVKEGDSLDIEATNEGNRHARVTELAFKTPNGKTSAHEGVLAYVLPGQTHSWTLPQKQEHQIATKNKQIELIAQTNTGTQKETLGIS